MSLHRSYELNKTNASRIAVTLLTVHVLSSELTSLVSLLSVTWLYEIPRIAISSYFRGRDLPGCWQMEHTYVRQIVKLASNAYREREVRERYSGVYKPNKSAHLLFKYAHVYVCVYVCVFVLCAFMCTAHNSE